MLLSIYLPDGIKTIKLSWPNLEQSLVFNSFQYHYMLIVSFCLALLNSLHFESFNKSGGILVIDDVSVSGC